jgi:hypothetical protein
VSPRSDQEEEPVPKPKSTRAIRRSDRQTSQRELIERGMKIPGVAEAVEAYGNLTRYSVRIAQTAPTLRYATGGNA